MRATRIIMHIDMDYFYAAVEEREDPSIKGKPVVVGADPKGGKGRGVVSTCNYEARSLKIHSGMPISKAYKLCPGCVFLPVRMELYEDASNSIMAGLRKYADKTEQLSIDEMYLDVSKKVRGFEGAERLAERIKKEIREKEKLTCSVGIGPNKLIAKIASDSSKPDGLAVVKPERVVEFIYPLSVRKIPGIGPKTEARLNEMKIATIKELSAAKQEMLIEEFGSFGHEMHLMSKGIDESEVEEKKGIKSISRLRTFEKDTKDESEVFGMVDELADEVYSDLKGCKLFYRTVTISVRFEDFDTHTTAKSFQVASGSLEQIKDTAKELMKKYLKDRRRIRQVGVRVSNFAEKEAQKQLV